MKLLCAQVLKDLLGEGIDVSLTYDTHHMLLMLSTAVTLMLSSCLFVFSLV